jgi:hypothetical protein
LNFMPFYRARLSGNKKNDPRNTAACARNRLTTFHFYTMSDEPDKLYNYTPGEWETFFQLKGRFDGLSRTVAFKRKQGNGGKGYPGVTTADLTNARQLIEDGIAKCKGASTGSRKVSETPTQPGNASPRTGSSRGEDSATPFPSLDWATVPEMDAPKEPQKPSDVNGTAVAAPTDGAPTKDTAKFASEHYAHPSHARDETTTTLDATSATVGKQVAVIAPSPKKPAARSTGAKYLSLEEAALDILNIINMVATCGELCCRSETTLHDTLGRVTRKTYTYEQDDQPIRKLLREFMSKHTNDSAGTTAVVAETTGGTADDPLVLSSDEVARPPASPIARKRKQRILSDMFHDRNSKAKANAEEPVQRKEL